MTTNFVNQAAIIDGSVSGTEDFFFLYGQADFVTFFHGLDDTLAVAENNATVNIQQSAFTTVYDFGKGLHINMDPFTIGTSIRNFQLDPTATIDMFSSPYTSQDDMINHMQVIPNFGTVFDSPLQGGALLTLPGDYAVNTSQIHVHPYTGPTS